MKKDKGDLERAVVLLSGGLDSTVSLALSRKICNPVTAIFFDYRQHASPMEERASRAVADHFGLGFVKFELHWLGGFSASSLIEGGGEPPRLKSGDLEEDAGGFSKEVWVENRNGIFINIAAAYAEGKGCGLVVVGFNAEEASAFPDNSEEYLRLVNESLGLGTGSSIRVIAPTISMTKSEIVREGLRLDIPWKMLWSCYRGGDSMCGNCESCLRLMRAVGGTPVEAELRF